MGRVSSLLVLLGLVSVAYGEGECDCTCDGDDAEEVVDYTLGVDISKAYGYGDSSSVPITLVISKSAECTADTEYAGCMVTFEYTKVVEFSDDAPEYYGAQLSRDDGLSWIALGFAKKTGVGAMLDKTGNPTHAVVGQSDNDDVPSVGMYELLSDDNDLDSISPSSALTADLTEASFSQDVASGTTSMKFTLPLSTVEVYADSDKNVNFLFSHGADQRFPRFHKSNRGYFVLNVRAIESGVVAEEIESNFVIKMQLTVDGIEKEDFTEELQDIFKANLAAALGVAAETAMDDIKLLVVLGYEGRIAIIASVTLPSTAGRGALAVETQTDPALDEFLALLANHELGSDADPSIEKFPVLVPGATGYKSGGAPEIEVPLLSVAEEEGGCFFDGASQYAMAQCFTSYDSLEETNYNATREAEFENTQDLNAEFRLSWNLLGYPKDANGNYLYNKDGLKTGCRHEVVGEGVRDARDIEYWADESQQYWTEETGEGSKLRRDGCEFLEVMIQSKTEGWVGLGFMAGGAQHGMVDTDIIWGMVIDGGLELIDAYAAGIFPPERDSSYTNGTDNLFNTEGYEEGGVTTIRFTRALQASDDFDRSIYQQKNTPIVFGYSRQGKDDLQLYHGPTRGFGQILFWENLRVCDESDYYPTFSEECDAEGFRTMEVSWFINDAIERGCVGDKPADKLDIVCEYVPADSSYGIIVIIAAGIGCIWSLLAMSWVLYNWNLPIVKYSQRPFCLIICFGGFFLCLSPILMLGEGSTPVCQVGLWMFHLSFEFLVVPLFLKVNRIFQVMQNKSLKRKKISDLQLTINIFLYVFIDVLILLFWAVFDIYELKHIDEQVDPFTSVDNQITHSYCTSDGRLFTTMSVLFKLFILLLGCYYAYQARNISDIFSESKQLMIIMMTISGMAAITMVVSYGSDAIPQTLKLTIQSVVISWATMITLGGIFIPKHMKFGKIKNTKELWSVNKGKNNTQNNTQTKTQTQSLKTATSSGEGEGAGDLESADDFALALTTLLEKVDDFELTDEIQDQVEAIITHLNTLDDEEDDDDDEEDKDDEDADGEDGDKEEDADGEDGDKEEDADKEEDGADKEDGTDKEDDADKEDAKNDDPENPV
jgi:hypothetical protein